MVRRCMPAILEQPHSAQFLQNHTTPVCRRTLPVAARSGFRRRTESRAPRLPFPIPTEPVGTVQPVWALVQAFHRSLLCNRIPDQPVNLFDGLNGYLNNTHIYSHSILMGGVRRGRSFMTQ
jgi:hypothetical protein